MTNKTDQQRAMISSILILTLAAIGAEASHHYSESGYSYWTPPAAANDNQLLPRQQFAPTTALERQLGVGLANVLPGLLFAGAGVSQVVSIYEGFRSPEISCHLFGMPRKLINQLSKIEAKKKKNSNCTTQKLP